MNVTVRNVITSMRMISTFDWADFFESVSLVDEVLRAGSDFAAMDFATRDRYRHAIEDLARGSGRSELDVARLGAAVSHAQASRAPPGDRRADPGFYLISKGRPLFEREIGYDVSPGRRLARRMCPPRRPTTSEPSPSSRRSSSRCLSSTLTRPTRDSPALALLGLVGLVPASDLAIALVNRAVMQLVGPRRCHAWRYATACRRG